MTLTRQGTVARAQEHLRTDDSTSVVDLNAVQPNPFQDLWLVGYTDP